MKVGHCQLECITGNYEQNLAKLVSWLEVADGEGLDIVSFPESFLTGYFTSPQRAHQSSLRIDGPQIAEVLRRTARFRPMFMVGFNELREDKLLNTVLVAESGRLVGTYSKAFPCFEYFTPGRDFPVFQRGDLRFGIVICADGGYIEPARILALKGAQIIFSPHYNYIAKENLINHFQHVRSDHIARAVENGVWFLRGNNVCSGLDEGLEYEGVGYGDSYLLDPYGEMVVRSQRHKECLISAQLDLSLRPPGKDRSRQSIAALQRILLQLLASEGESG
jgi:predicted amidohydrolase